MRPPPMPRRRRRRLLESPFASEPPLPCLPRSRGAPRRRGSGAEASRELRAGKRSGFGPHYTRSVGSWYWIGVCAGLGVAIGVLLSGLLAGTRTTLIAAFVV